jgi:hypothetical protein
MKMGNTRSPWRYDAGTRHALQSLNLRWPAILRYDSWALSFRFARWSGYASIAALWINPVIDEMGPKQTARLARYSAMDA